MSFTKKIKRTSAIFLSYVLMMFTFSSTTFASINENFQKSTAEFTNNSNYSLITENNPISSKVSRTGATLAKFSGVYYGWLDVPFTVTDSSQTVKVLFSAKTLNSSDITTSARIKKSNGSLWFWNQNNKSGSNHIYTVGKLKTGSYILRIKTNQSASGYSIAGEVYYY